MNMKKILIIIGSIIGVLGLGFLGYWFFVTGTITIDVQPNSSNISIDGQSSGNGHVSLKVKRGVHQIEVKNSGYTTILTSIKIFGLQKKSVNIKLEKLPEAVMLKKNITTLNTDNEYKNLLLGSKDGAEFIKYDPVGKKEDLLSRIDFGKELKVKWSPNNFLAYIWRADKTSGLVDLKRYDLLTQTFTIGKAGVMDLAWTSDGEKVAYTYKPGDGEFSLVQSSPLGENMERLYFHLDKEKITDPYLEWTKDGKDILLQDKDIFVYNLYSHKLTKITKSGEMKWARLSKSGKYIIYADKSKTYLVSLGGKSVNKWMKSLDSAEWLEDGQEIVGVAGGEFYKINAQTGEVIDFGYNGKRIKDVVKFGFINDGKTAYFLRKNGELWKLDLQRKLSNASKEG